MLRAALWASLAISSVHPAFGDELPASRKLVAVVAGFELCEQDVPGGVRYKKTLRPYNLIDVIRRIALAKRQLEKQGVEATPAAVTRWRDAKLTQLKERARILREVMAHPDQARTIYETTSSSAIAYGSWLSWTLNYRTEERIAAWENQPTVGKYRFDLSKGTQPSLWMLLESMVEERDGLGRPRVAEYTEVLANPDIEILQSLARSWAEDADDGLVFKRGVEVSSEARAMLDNMVSWIYLEGFEKGLIKIIERESIQKANVKILEPELLIVNEFLAKRDPSELTRIQLIGSMTLPEAVGALSDRNGRLTMAMLTLAKSKASAVPMLLESLRVKEARSNGHALVLLKWLDARQSLDVVHELKLWNEGNDDFMNAAFSLIAKFDPASLEAVLGEIVAGFEAQPVYSGIGKSYASPQVRRCALFLAKHQPIRGLKVLKTHLSSPKPGVRLAAGRALAEIGDASGVKYALEFMEHSGSESERYHALDIVQRVGGPKDARSLDAMSLRLNAPELAVSARDLEFAFLPAGRRWPYVRQYLGNKNKMVDYWAFAKVEEGFHRNDPKIGPILEFAAAQDGTVWQRRAKELLGIRARKRP